MQGAEKISQRRICLICKQEIFSATQQLGFMPFSGMKSGFIEVPWGHCWKQLCSPNVKGKTHAVQDNYTAG